MVLPGLDVQIAISRRTAYEEQPLTTPAAASAENKKIRTREQPPALSMTLSYHGMPFLGGGGGPVA